PPSHAGGGSDERRTTITCHETGSVAIEVALAQEIREPLVDLHLEVQLQVVLDDLRRDVADRVGVLRETNDRELRVGPGEVPALRDEGHEPFVERQAPLRVLDAELCRTRLS